MQPHRHMHVLSAANQRASGRSCPGSSPTDFAADSTLPQTQMPQSIAGIDTTPVSDATRTRATTWAGRYARHSVPPRGGWPRKWFKGRGIRLLN